MSSKSFNQAIKLATHIVVSANQAPPDRSSLSVRISSLAQVGGVNSLENFARSWQRAAGFYELTHATSSFAVSEGDHEGRLGDEEQGPKQPKSLLRQQFEQGGRSLGSAAHEGPQTVEQAQSESSERPEPRQSWNDRAGNIFAHAPYLASPFASDYAGSYDSLSARVNSSAKQEAARLFRQQQASGMQESDKEREPLLVKTVEREDGQLITVVIGQSTLPQTVFNSLNVLIGVGILSLPLGIKYAGWIPGILFLVFFAAINNYTAKLLGKCLELDKSLITFGDLAYASFGKSARIATSILFTLELIAACVALVVLFADSLDALISGWGVIEWKIVCGVIFVPLSFVPLRLLSISSVLGIVCGLGSKSSVCFHVCNDYG